MTILGAAGGHPPAAPAINERTVLRLGLALVASFLILAIVTGPLSMAGLHGWVAIHLTLAGAATVAIGTFMPHFGVTLAGTRPEPPALRLAGVLSLGVGMMVIALGRPALGDEVAAGGGLLVLLGIGLTAWNTYAPLRSGLARRHPIAQAAYGLALAELAVGVSLAVLFLLGHEPITRAWINLKPAHVWLNALGFVSLTIAGTLIYLYPTMLGARIRAHVTLFVALIGLGLGPLIVAIGAAAAWPGLAIAGGAVSLAGSLGLLGYGIDAWRRRGRWANDKARHDLAVRHGLAGMAWLVVALAALLVGLVRDGGSPPGWTIGAAAVPLIGGWAMQELVGAWGHLLPAAGPGSMETKARQRATLSRWGTTRVVGWNFGLAVTWLGLGLDILPLAGVGLVTFGIVAGLTLVLFVAALLARPAVATRSPAAVGPGGQPS
ncbi:MAG: hypothetical protein ABIW50_09090 [Candidatus Limnocylindria bacterium]